MDTANEVLHGKAIAEIIFNDADGTGINAHGGQTLVMSSTFHGDRDEHWVIQLNDGKEIARHNCKAIKSIYWAS